MIEAAMEKVLKIRTEQGITTALKSDNQPSAKFLIKPGDEVLEYSERERKWIPNLRFVDDEGKNVWIITGQRIVKLNITRIPPQITEEDDR